MRVSLPPGNWILAGKSSRLVTAPDPCDDSVGPGSSRVMWRGMHETIKVPRRKSSCTPPKTLTSRKHESTDGRCSYDTKACLYRARAFVGNSSAEELHESQRLNPLAIQGCPYRTILRRHAIYGACLVRRMPSRVVPGSKSPILRCMPS